MNGYTQLTQPVRKFESEIADKIRADLKGTDFKETIDDAGGVTFWVAKKKRNHNHECQENYKDNGGSHIDRRLVLQRGRGTAR